MKKSVKLMIFALVLASSLALYSCEMVKWNLVSFDTNGAEQQLAQVSVKNGSEFIIPEAKLTQEGKRFLFFRNNGKNYAVGDKLTVNGDITLKAIWAVPVTYLGEQAEYIEEGTELLLKEYSGEVPAGKYFIGWEVNGEIYGPNDNIEVLEATTVNPVFGDYIVVSFNANGGAGEMASLNVLPGDSVTIPDNMFTKTGLHFLGFRGEGEELLEPGETFVPTNSLSLKAIWGYRVTFELDGTKDTVQVEEGTEYKLPVPEVPAGHLFSGWSDGQNYYEGGAAYELTGDVKFTGSIQVDYSVISNKRYENPNGGFYALPLLSFNSDNEITNYYVCEDDYNSLTYCSPEDLKNTDSEWDAPFNGTALKYSGVYYYDDYVMNYVSVTFDGEGLAVIEIYANKEDSTPAHTAVLYGYDMQGTYSYDKATYNGGDCSLIEYAFNGAHHYAYNSGEGYFPVKLDGKWTDGNIVAVVSEDGEVVCNIRRDGDQFAFRGEEYGAVVNGWTLDGFGNAVNGGESVDYYLAGDGCVALGGKFYKESAGAYTEHDADGMQGKYTAAVINAYYGLREYVLELDGHGTAFGTYSGSNYKGSYTLNESLSVAIEDGNNGYFDGEYTLSENGKLFFNSYKTFVAEDYATENTLDKTISGIKFEEENSYYTPASAILNAENKTVTLTVPDEYISGQTVGYQFAAADGSILEFMLNGFQWYIVIVDKDEICVYYEGYYGYDTVTLKKTIQVTIKAEGYPDQTAFAANGGSVTVDLAPYMGNANGKHIKGWLAENVEYGLNEAIPVSDGLVINAVFEEDKTQNFIGSWHRAQSEDPQSLIVKSENGKFTVEYDSGEVVYFAATENTFTVYYLSYGTLYDTEFELQSDALYSSYNKYWYKGEYSSARCEIGYNTYCINKIGEKLWSNYPDSTWYEFTLSAGEFKDGSEITLKKSESEDTFTVKLKASGSEEYDFDMLFKGEEAGKSVDGWTLDGYGTAEKNGETTDYTVNASGDVTLDGKTYELKDGEYVEKQADKMAGVVLTDYKDGSTYTFDGFGSVTYKESYSDDVIYPYTLSDNTITIKKSSYRSVTLTEHNGYYTDSDDEVWAKSEDNYNEFSSDLSGEYADGQKKVIFNVAEKTITLENISSMIDGTYHYTQRNSALATININDYDCAFAVSEGTMMLQYRTYYISIVYLQKV